MTEIPGYYDQSIYQDRPLSRENGVAEIQQLISQLNCEFLLKHLHEAKHILVVGPGFNFPELELFSSVIYHPDGSIKIEISPSLEKVVLVDKDPLIYECSPKIYHQIEKLPQFIVYQETSFAEYFELNHQDRFDLIFDLRMENLGRGKRPEFHAKYLSKLLLPGGIAVITGDADGIKRLISSSTRSLRVLIHKEELPEGYVGRFANSHDGVVLIKPEQILSPAPNLGANS